MTRIRNVTPIDPTDRLATRIKTLEQQIAELQRAGSRPPVEQSSYIVYVPGGNVDATVSAAWSDWLTLGDVTVPAWATNAIITVAINGFYDITAANNVYALRPKLGTPTGSAAPNVRGVGTSARTGATVIDTVSGLSSGSQSLRLQAYKLGGGGQFRADGSVVVSAVVVFKP